MIWYLLLLYSNHHSFLIIVVVNDADMLVPVIHRIRAIPVRCRLLEHLAAVIICVLRSILQWFVEVSKRKHFLLSTHDHGIWIAFELVGVSSVVALSEGSHIVVVSCVRRYNLWHFFKLFRMTIRRGWVKILRLDSCLWSPHIICLYNIIGLLSAARNIIDSSLNSYYLKLILREWKILMINYWLLPSIVRLNFTV